MAESTDPKTWLKLAEEEFLYASRDLEEKDFTFFAPTCFHFHQAAEKHLKAYILACGKTFRKIHNLVELVRICTGEDSDFETLLNDAALLNPFYTDTRYPVHWPMDFKREDAETAKEAAQRIGDFVKEKLGKKIKQ